MRNQVVAHVALADVHGAEGQSSLECDGVTRAKVSGASASSRSGGAHPLQHLPARMEAAYLVLALALGVYQGRQAVYRVIGESLPVVGGILPFRARARIHSSSSPSISRCAEWRCGRL